MLIIPRKTVTLEVLEILRRRGKLNPADDSSLYRLTKGFEGERKFADILTKELKQPFIVLYGILLEHSKSHFQIDCLIINKGVIYLIDIKYSSDEYYYHQNDFYLIKNKDKIDNPLHQLERCEGLLRKLLKQYNFHYEVSSHMIFLHPEFTLYAAPIKENIILPSQTMRFVRKLNNIPAQITPTELRLKNFFYEQHQEKSIYDVVPEVNFDELRKGIFCKKCRSIMESLKGRGKISMRFQCRKCKLTEPAKSAILRTIIEYNKVFPKEKITTQIIYEWCDKKASVKLVREILSNYLSLERKGNQSHYVFIDQRF